MKKFYKQELRRIDGEQRRIEEMSNTRERKQNILKIELETFFNKNSKNWQEGMVMKRKIEDLKIEIECLEEWKNIYDRQKAKYVERLNKLTKNHSLERLKLE